MANKRLSYYLYSQNCDKNIIVFEKFDKDSIKKSILEWLNNPDNSTDVIEYRKECSASELKRFAGDDILGFYGVNPKNGKPSRIITKGNKDYYLSLLHQIN